MLVSAKQVQKNREGIKAMWKNIPAKWVYLDTFISTDSRKKNGDEYSKRELVRKCDGKGGPHNECGAVGCFAGWNWMYHPYQAWCKRNKLTIASTVNLDIFLGLAHQEHDLYAGRQYEEEGMSEKKAVNIRIAHMMRSDICEREQLPVYEGS